jgi:hypothetical protein
MRSILRATLVAALVSGLLGCSIPLPPQPVLAAIIELAKTTSFHARVTTRHGETNVDYFALDRFERRTTTSDTIVVGTSVYVRRLGPPRSAPHGALHPWKRYRRLGHRRVIDEYPGRYLLSSAWTFTDLGADTLDGKPTRKFRVLHARGRSLPTILWIGNDSRVYRIDGFLIGFGQGIIRYSDYNRVAPIHAPIATRIGGTAPR